MIGQWRAFKRSKLSARLFQNIGRPMTRVSGQPMSIDVRKNINKINVIELSKFNSGVAAEPRAPTQRVTVTHGLERVSRWNQRPEPAHGQTQPVVVFERVVFILTPHTTNQRFLGGFAALNHKMPNQSKQPGALAQVVPTPCVVPNPLALKIHPPDRALLSP